MRYTEGICGDGAVILDNGLPISISEVLAALNSISQWQQIETVPQDKTVFVVESGVVQKCAFEFNGEYWIISDIDEPVDEEFKPTHWQPLPQPPNDLGDL